MGFGVVDVGAGAVEGVVEGLGVVLAVVGAAAAVDEGKVVAEGGGDEGREVGDVEMGDAGGEVGIRGGEEGIRVGEEGTKEEGGVADIAVVAMSSLSLRGDRERREQK